MFRDTIDACLVKKRIGYHYYNCPEDDTCVTLMLGKLMQWLKSNEFWPLPDAATMVMTISELTRRAGNCVISGSRGSCTLIPKIGDQLNSITNAIQVPQKIVAHVSSQAKKTGLTT